MGECKLFPKLVPKDEAKADSISPHSFAGVGGGVNPEIIQPRSSRNTLYLSLLWGIFPEISQAAWPTDCVTLQQDQVMVKL